MTKHGDQHRVLFMAAFLGFTLGPASMPGALPVFAFVKDVQAPRGEDVQAPRGEDVQAPRGEHVQAPQN